MRWTWLLLACLTALAQTPAILDLVRERAEALANQEPSVFLEAFDPDMPGYAKLREEIEALVAEDVASTVEVVRDEGDDRARRFEMDWLIKIGRRQSRRAILKCSVERRGKKWKITALEPVEFFRRE